MCLTPCRALDCAPEMERLAAQLTRNYRMASKRSHQQLRNEKLMNLEQGNVFVLKAVRIVSTKQRQQERTWYFGETRSHLLSQVQMACRPAGTVEAKKVGQGEILKGRIAISQESKLTLGVSPRLIIRGMILPGQVLERSLQGDGIVWFYNRLVEKR